MDRRTALMMTMLMGGWLPRGVFAQGAGRKTSSSRVAVRVMHTDEELMIARSVARVLGSQQK